MLVSLHMLLNTGHFSKPRKLQTNIIKLNILQLQDDCKIIILPSIKTCDQGNSRESESGFNRGHYTPLCTVFLTVPLNKKGKTVKHPITVTLYKKYSQIHSLQPWVHYARLLCFHTLFKLYFTRTFI